jgi:hypothetical protein
VLSFNAQALACMAERHPAIPRGLNIREAPTPANLLLGQSDFFSLDIRLVQSIEVQSWRAAGNRAIAWTVRSQEELEGLDRLVDNVIFEGFSP